LEPCPHRATQALSCRGGEGGSPSTVGNRQNSGGRRVRGYGATQCTEMFLFPLCGPLVDGPQYAVGYSLLRVGGSFRPRKAASWCVISGHRYRVLGGPTTVRVVLARQRWLSMPRFSPPSPIRGLCTGLRAPCEFIGGRADAG